MQRMIREDNAVEGIPLKLIIVVLILAITIPLVWTTMVIYDRNQKENDIRNEIEFIITTIKFVYTNGEDNSQLISVDFSSSFATKVEKVEIGDDKDGLWSTIRYKLNNMAKVTIVIDNPNIPVANRTNTNLNALVIGDGKHTLLFTTRNDNDFDGDGYNDLYVEVAAVK